MADPIITILTPVYNGEAYLRDCIESVLAQERPDFKYIIVNNCSKDKSGEIAEAYAKKDSRVQVHTNGKFVSAIENHNIAFNLVPPDSKYCKIVSADDWIMPDCLAKLVALAEMNPSVGIVGCYQRSGDRVRWQGIPNDINILSGREAARLGLLRGVHVFGTPTSVLYRSSLVRMRDRFFPHNRAYADTSACFDYLQYCDFGFVHEELAVERVHDGQWSAEMDKLESSAVAFLDILTRYGHFYLTEKEFEARKKEAFDIYFRNLGGCFWKMKGPSFWKFHREVLNEIGYDLPWLKVAAAAIKEALAEMKDPIVAFKKLCGVISARAGMLRLQGPRR